MNMDNRKTLLITGELILDIAPSFLGNPVKNLEEKLIPGRATLMGKCGLYVGAMGNTALVAKRLGGEPLLAGRIGDDLYGKVMVQILEDQTIAHQLTVDKEAVTPYSIVLAVPGKDRMFLYNPDAAWRFTESEISDALLQEAEILHFGYPMAMKNMYRAEGIETVTLLKRGKEQGAITSMDFCFIDEAESGPHQDWRKILQNAGTYLDVFAPGIEELMYYTDRKKYDRMQKGGGNFLEKINIQRDVEPMADWLLSLGIGIVMVKCGVKGIYLKTACKERISKIADRIPISVAEWTKKTTLQPIYPVEQVCSAAGAGDAAIAAFLIALQKGFCPETALKLAAKAGSRCVMSNDSYSNQITIDMLLKEI